MKKILLSFLLTVIMLALVSAWLRGTLRAAARQAEDLQSFTLVLDLAAGESAEAVIDSQIALAELLGYLQQRGSVVSFIPYYGANRIDVQGTAAVRSYLDEYPGVSIPDVDPSMDLWPALAAYDEVQGPGGTGAISGITTDATNGSAIAGIKVTLWYFTGSLYLPIKNFTTGSNGLYQFSELIASSNYKVQFEDTLGGYVKQYYSGKFSLLEADKVNVEEGKTTQYINAAMQPSGKISGTVTKSGGQGVSDIVVNAYQSIAGQWVLMKFTTTNASGFYTLDSLPIGNHRVRFSDPYQVPRYVTEYFPNHDLIDLANDVPVTARNTTQNINVQLGGWGSLSGAVTGQGGTTNMTGIQMDVWGEILTQWSQEVSGTAVTASNGTYTSGFLGTRDYRLRFSDPYGMYLTEYYNGATIFDNATNVHVELGYNTPNINITLELNPSAPITQTFGTGWYLIGWPVNLANSLPENVFSPIASTLGIVYDYNACPQTPVWTSYDPGKPPELNNMSPLARSEGYWVRNNGSATLTVRGQYSVSTDIILCTGWNLIGYPAARPQPIQEVLLPISGKYSLVYGYDGNDLADPWEKYDPAYTVGNDLTTLQPGRAYWVNMKQDATLTVLGR